jgi:O-antigen/teichoic acid export membrane protein
LLLLLFTGAVWRAGIGNWVWPDQEMYFVLLAAIWGLLTWYGRVMHNTVDAYGLTKLGEARLIIQRLLGLVLLIGLYWFDWLDLQRFFFYHYIVLVSLIVAWHHVLRSNGVESTAPLKREELSSYGSEFYSYSAPLLVFGMVGLFGGVLDRWLLQYFAGSVEQGLFGLAYQIGSIGTLFTGAMTPLITREFASLHENKDIEGMRTLFMRYVPMLYLVTAIVAGFLTIHATRVSYLVAGDEYLGASTAVSLMALYPVHQTYGQLSGAVFYATGQTALYRNLGVFSVVIGILVSLWLLAPEEYGGMDMKATGLAGKMLVMQIVAVNLQLWFNAKYLELPLRGLVAHQVIVLVIAMILSWGVGAAVDSLIGVGSGALLVNGVLYLLSCAGLVYLFPSSVASSRTELRAVMHKLLLRQESEN